MKIYITVILSIFCFSLYSQKSKDDINLLFNATFAEASKMKMQKHYDDAKQLYAKCLEYKPKSSAAMYELSRILSGSGDIRGAIKLMEEAVSINGTNKWYLSHLFELYKYALNYKDAEKIKRKLISIYPNDPIHYYDLLALFQAEKNDKKILRCFDEIEKKFGKNEVLIEEKVKYYIMNNNSEKALELLKDLLDNDPHNINYLNVLAEVYSALKEFDKALDIYNKLLPLSDELSTIYISKAEIFYYQKNNDSLIEQFSFIFSDKSIDFELKKKIYDTYFLQNTLDDEFAAKEYEMLQLLYESNPKNVQSNLLIANYLLKNNEQQKAAKYLYNILSIDKSIYEVYSQLFFIEHANNNWKVIDSLANESIELYPNQFLGYYYKSLCYYMNKDYKGALDYLNSGVIYVLDDKLKLEFYSLMAECHYNLGNIAKTFNYYDEILKINPKNSTVLNNYSYYLSVDNKDLEKALQMTKLSNELAKDNPIFLDTYAWVLFKMDKFSEAQRIIEKAITLLEEDNGEIYEHYGDILYKNGNLDKAVQYWIKAKETGEASDSINKKIQNKTIE